MAQWLNWGDGHDGSPAVSGTINTYAACTGTAGQTVLTTSLAASDGDQILVHQTQHASAGGTWEIVKVSSDAGATLNLYSALVNSYSTGAQAVLIPQYTGGNISGAVTATAWAGSSGGIIALISNGDLTISGSVVVSSKGFRTSGLADPVGKAGESSLGLGSASTSPNGAGGGGGSASAGAGGSYDGTGGTGGTNDQTVNPTNPALNGSPIYTKMFIASAGGCGSNGNNGGLGSGAILIIAKNLTVTGTLTAAGGAGGTADRPGGGGAGGFILIKTQVATLGTNKLTSPAGAAGGRSNSWNGYPTAGTTGRIRCDYFTSVSGTTTPTLSSAQDTTLNIASGSGFFNFF